MGHAEDASAAAINAALQQLDSTISGMIDGSTPLTSPDINGGSIDGAPIGATAAAAGTFTTLAATGVLTLGDTLLVWPGRLSRTQ